MIRTIDLRGHPELLTRSLPRAAQDTASVTDAVRGLIEQVRRGGAQAVLALSERFDGIRPPALRVDAAAIAAALAALSPALRAALTEMIHRVRVVHHGQRRAADVAQIVPGGTVTTRWVPVERVGLYVPGGRAVYPSTVVMSVVPAQEAGVGEIAICSPPQPTNGGLADATVLAVAGLLGVREVYSVGGVQAIAMLAYGLEDADGRARCRPVDVIAGPGNVWVATAKQLLQSVVGIDAIAGPTEIMVLADRDANPAWVAADLISQAEHDPLAAALLVTDSEELARAVTVKLTALVPRAAHSERIAAALHGQQSAILLVDDLDDGLEVVNAYGPEHLEIQARDASAWAGRVRNAGAVFVGAHSPVALGDYLAGSNHVLPTGGSAHRSGALSVQSFLRAIDVVSYDGAALETAAPYIETLARSEDLPAHSDAVAARFQAT